MKRLFSLSLAMIMLLGTIQLACFTGFAADQRCLTFQQTGEDTCEVIDCDESAAGSLQIPSTYIGKKVTSIGLFAFKDCNLLTEISIPDCVTSIGYLDLCKGLESITVDPMNENYSSQDGVLFNKDKTVLINYPAAKSGKSYDVPTSVKYIQGLAFSYCEFLSQISIPDSVISASDFTHFEGLESIIVDPNNINYSSQDGVLFNKDKTYLCRYPSGKSTTKSYTVPSSVVRIGDGAFYKCVSLESITVPNGVTSIDDYAFESCEELKSITLSNKLTVIQERTFCKCRSLESIVIPNGVTAIETCAFESCDSLVSITIPKSVTSVEAGAFNYDVEVANVYYAGTKAEWENINFGVANEGILNATIHFEGENNFFQKIINFFQKIADFFKSLFGIK